MAWLLNSLTVAFWRQLGSSCRQGQLCSPWFPGPGAFTPTSLTSKNSLAQDWAAGGPPFLGDSVPGALISLVGLLPTVLMLVPFAMGL